MNSHPFPFNPLLIFFYSAELKYFKQIFISKYVIFLLKDVLHYSEKRVGWGEEGDSRALLLEENILNGEL